MNEQAQRIAIAEACGWKMETIQHPKYDLVVIDNNGGQIAWGRLNGRTKEQLIEDLAYILPDYINDLNAMHEAEKVLTRDQIDSYVYELHELIGRNHIERYAITATSAQRAKAFLRTLNLWKE